MLVLRWNQRARCFFCGRPKGPIRGPKGHSALWKRPSENLAGGALSDPVQSSLEGLAPRLLCRSSFIATGKGKAIYSTEMVQIIHTFTAQSIIDDNALKCMGFQVVRSDRVSFLGHVGGRKMAWYPSARLF